MTSSYRCIMLLIVGMVIGPLLTAAQTASGTTAAGSAGCQNSWALTANVNVAGGTVNPASNLADCQAACIASTTCQSIDFTAGAAVGQQCWLNSAQGPKTAFNGNNHYDLTRPAANCACTPSWVLTANVNVAGGTVNPATNLADCQAACIASPTCQSIDFTTGAAVGQQCWLGTAQTPKTAFNGNNHYDLTRAAANCGGGTTVPAGGTTVPAGGTTVPAGGTTAPGSSTCVQIWLLTANVNIIGGTVVAAATTVAACQAACIASTTCQSIDFTPTAAAGQQCWLSNSQTPSGTFAGNNHYDLTTRPAVSCNAACTQVWVQTNGVNVAGGTVNAATTLAACQAACIASTTCQSLDFTATAAVGSQCWLATTQTPKTAFIGNTHFDLTARATATCGGGTGTIPSFTTAPVCVPTFQLTTGVSVPNGQVVSSANTVDDCKAACVNAPTCQSIDFTPGNPSGGRCYTNTATSPRNTFIGNDHYDLITRTCSQPPSQQQQCQIWLAKEGGVISIDRNSQQLVLVQNINQAACTVSSSPCLGAAVNPVANTSNCISISAFNTPGVYARITGNNLFVQPQTSQLFPTRFAEDASFWVVQDALNTGYTSLQPVMFTNNSYYYTASGPVGSLQITASGSIITQATKDSGSFVLVNALIPTAAGVSTSCPNVWTRINGAMGPRTVNKGNIALSDCRASCLVYPNCVGVSYDWSGRTCYLETRSPPNATFPRLVQNLNFQYYDLSAKFQSSCTRGATYTYLDSVNTTLASVYLTTYSYSFYACRQFCILSIPNCIGISYAPGAPAACTIVTSGFLASTTLTNYQPLVRTRVIAGPCAPQVTITVGYQDALANVTVNGINTINDCHTVCINNPLCTGFDFDTVNACYLSTTFNPVLTPLRNDSTHYDIVRRSCGNGCQDKWNFFAETTSASSTVISGFNSELDCRQACQFNSTCSAANWNYVTSTCAFSTDTIRKIEGTSPGWSYFGWTQMYYCDNDSDNYP